MLAAGMGSRLAPITSCVPKPLLPLKGERLIDFVVRYLKEKCEEIFVVGGHLWELMERYLGRKHPDVRLVWADKVLPGNLYTLMRVRHHLEEDFVIANADHLFPKDVWDVFPAPVGGIQLACHRKGTRVFLEDEMKIREEKGFLLFMDKKLSAYDGAYTGLAYVGKDAVKVFWNRAEELTRSLGDLAKVEDLFNSLVREVRPRIVWIDKVPFYEVDTIHDLRRVWHEARARAL